MSQRVEKSDYLRILAEAHAACIEWQIKQLHEKLDKTRRTRDAYALLAEFDIQFKLSAYDNSFVCEEVTIEQLRILRKALGRLRIRYKSAVDQTTIRVFVNPVDPRYNHLEFYYDREYTPLENSRCQIVKEQSQFTNYSLVCST